MKNPDKVLQGRLDNQAGISFEERVAEVYRLLNYEVEHGRLFSGRQIDLFLTGRFGDLTVHRAIECKLGEVKADHIDAFSTRLRLVRRDYPAAQGTIVSGASFTDAVAAHAAAEGIQLTLFKDLAAQLIDGYAYANNLIRECEANRQYPMELYIEPHIGTAIDGEAQASWTVINEWLKDSEWNQLTLLGDVGTGKSFLTRMTAYRLAKAFLESPFENPLPVLIDLRNADRQFSLEGLIVTHLFNCGLPRVSFEIFLHSLSQGNIVLLLDGFDEMAARVTPNVTQRNFHELARCVKNRAKVMLTCRTHYFKSRTEEEEVILGGGQRYGSDLARDLYWDLIARKGFKIAYLRPFTVSQIEEYVLRARPKTGREALRKIRETYNLMELSHRPMLLEMIVKSIESLQSSEINAATLYAVYTDAWVHRDQWRDVLSPTAKLSFLTELAIRLWDQDARVVHYTQLGEYLRIVFGSEIENMQQFVEIDNEIRTASFLTREETGNYGFAHKSYMEYFVARDVAAKLNHSEIDAALFMRLLSPEIIGFLAHMLKLDEVEELLSWVVTYGYSPRVSENALLLLYGLKRHEMLNGIVADERDADQPIIELPHLMNLGGARLDHVSLEGASMYGVNLINASLTHAILDGGKLIHANLNGANCTKGSFRDVDFTNSSLRKARFEQADLHYAVLAACDLQKCDFTEAILSGANMDGALTNDAVFLGTLWAPAGSGADDETNMLAQFYGWIYSHQLLFVKIVRRSGTTPGYKTADDVISETAVSLAASRLLPQIMSMDDVQRTRFFSQELRRMTRAQGAQTSDISLDQFDDEELGYSFDPETEEETAVMLDEEVERVSQIASRILAPQTWRILQSRFVLGDSISNIAKQEGISARTVQRHITKGRELLRAELK